MKMPWDTSWSDSEAGRKFDADQEKRLKRGIKRAQKEEATWSEEKRLTYAAFKPCLIASFIVFGLPVLVTMRYFLVLVVLGVELVISVAFLIAANIRRGKVKFPICYKTPLFAFCACTLMFLSDLGGNAISNAIQDARERKAQENAIANDAETQRMIEEMNRLFGKQESAGIAENETPDNNADETTDDSTGSAKTKEEARDE